jgi:hypothetical protein
VYTQLCLFICSAHVRWDLTSSVHNSRSKFSTSARVPGTTKFSIPLYSSSVMSSVRHAAVFTIKSVDLHVLLQGRVTRKGYLSDADYCNFSIFNLGAGAGA